jgi:hypothetical protein
MTRYFPKAKERKVKNLLSNKAGAEAEIEVCYTCLGEVHISINLGARRHRWSLAQGT